jgi:perosamine synthetase
MERHVWRPLIRIPPGGGPVSTAQLRAVVRQADAGRALQDGLRAKLGATQLTLHASGREALRVAFVHLAAECRRTEILIPAYTCFSIPAAAVAAGLQVRLVDVGLDGCIDSEALARTPLDGVAALVIGNLFGIPERVSPLRPILSAHGVAIVDDAAQSLGARSPEGPVGGRGDVGVLSFGRGKPLSALGGGALAWSDSTGPTGSPAPAAPRRLTALSRAAIYNLALLPPVFRWLAAVPALEIGETRYDPNFPRGAIDGASLCLAAAALSELEETNRKRARCALELARRVKEETRFSPLLAADGCDGVYPRLGLIAPSHAARSEALRSLAPIGATRMYPGSLDGIEKLRPHLAGEPKIPGAREFASRLLTLPTGKALRGERRELAVRTLRELS